MTSHLLSLVIFLPLAGAVFLAFLPAAEKGQLRAGALVVSLATLAASLLLWTRFSPAGAQFQLEERLEWAPALGISYHVGIDGVALVLMLLTTVLSPIVLLSTWNAIQERVKELCLLLLFLETAMLGTFAALDLILFYVFWEAMLIPMYLLIGVWGSERRIYAAVKFFLFTMFGSVLMLVAIVYLYFAAGKGTFDVPVLLETLKLPADTQLWLFGAFALAFAIKVPMFPLHTWLPDAHVEAPAAGSVILAAVLLKMGTFGFVRYAIPLFPEATLQLQKPIAALAVVGIIYGALMCLAQTDMKKLIAYSSVSHLGFVMLGLMALTPEAVTGAVYQMLNHGVSTGGLFLLVGILYERRHTRAIADFGGLARVIPGYAAVLMVVTLSSIGLPGTNGFVGEFLILSGTWTAKAEWGRQAAALGALGVVLGAVYMLWLYQKTMLGPLERAENRAIADLGRREWTVMAPILALALLMGIWPQPILRNIEPSSLALIQRIGDQAGGAAPALATGPRPALQAPPPGGHEGHDHD